MDNYIVKLRLSQKANIMSLLMAAGLHGDALWKRMNGRVCDLLDVASEESLRKAVAA